MSKCHVDNRVSLNGHNGNAPLPVRTHRNIPDRLRSKAVVMRQVGGVAATGFVAGAATIALLKRHGSKLSRRPRRRKKQGPLAEILGTKSFLVDVHWIRRDK